MSRRIIFIVLSFGITLGSAPVWAAPSTWGAIIWAQDIWPSDIDSDGVADSQDNCLSVSNVSQLNSDGDLYGDACDPFPNDSSEWSDSDADGVGDNADACPGADDTADLDGDSLPDLCDPFPNKADEWKDTDGDGYGDNIDNCVTVPNGLTEDDQFDEDGDAIGDACDSSPNTPGYGTVMDAPHNYTRGITCETCHTYSIWWQYSPMEQNAQYATKTNNICFTCHGSGVGAINEVHSSVAMGTSHRGTLGTWSSKCVDCHNPHEQEQVEWSGTGDETNLYLITAKFGSTFIVDYGQTVFDYTDLVVNNSDFTTPATWSDKDTTGYPNGLILVVDTANALNTYEVISATGSSITVKGGVDPALATTSFGLIYGRLIRETINTPSSVERKVRYFESVIGSYTDTNTPATGLCQVCHENTLAWSSDGEGATHHPEEKCTNCHEHTEGFKANMVDTEPPVISLKGSTSETVECAGTYTDPGSTVTDNAFWGLSATVTGTVDEAVVGIYTLHYNAQDNYGNDAIEVTRDVTVRDTTAPIINLIGSSSITLSYGNTYTEEGADVVDSCGAPAVTIAGDTVDANTAGAYIVTYDVTDDEGNVASQATRTVEVECDSSDILLCQSSSSCTNAGGNWWSDNTCVGVPESETVVSAGEVWMSYNLGAFHKVALNSKDTAAYGDLYQWGRAADGHESRSSTETVIQSSTDDPGHNDFILSTDWRVPRNDNLWQGVSGINNPCPAGFRLPTEAEFATELSTWSSNDANGAFASPLKLVVAGYRSRGSGFVASNSTTGRYWTSTVTTGRSSFLYFNNYVNTPEAIIYTQASSEGMSVRCFKD